MYQGYIKQQFHLDCLVTQIPMQLVLSNMNINKPQPHKILFTWPKFTVLQFEVKHFGIHEQCIIYLLFNML